MMKSVDLGFHHRYEPGPDGSGPTLLLLHGTGGSESDLLDLGRHLLPGASLLSPRGAVDENGMARFFRRVAEGVFDLDDLRRRSADLAQFVATAGVAYGFDPARVVAVGYSNGANIAASLLLLHPQVLESALLFRAMVPLVPETLPDLRGVSVFMASARQDHVVPPEQAENLGRLLRDSGADVTLRWGNGGHGLTREEIEEAAGWLGARSMV